MREGKEGIKERVLIEWSVEEKIVEGVKCISRKGLFVYVFRGRGGGWVGIVW